MQRGHFVEEGLAGLRVAIGARRRNFVQLQSGKSDVSESFVALAARGDQNRVAADNGLLRRFARTGTKRTLPEHGLGILKITTNEELDFVAGGGEIHDAHLAAKAIERVIAGGDDAATGVENKIALGILFETGENFVEHSDFFGQVLIFALRISWCVGPAHPGRDTVDASVAAGFEDGSEASFDLIVAADSGTAEGSEIVGPVGFTRTRHTDESET